MAFHYEERGKTNVNWSNICWKQPTETALCQAWQHGGQKLPGSKATHLPFRYGTGLLSDKAS